MVTPYVPEAGDIVMLDFDPQVGREQAKRRPALVLTDQRYNRASGLAVVCPWTSSRAWTGLAAARSFTPRPNLGLSTRCVNISPFCSRCANEKSIPVPPHHTVVGQ